MKRYRIYIDYVDAPLPWSIDEGDISTERHFAAVELRGCSGYTGRNQQADNQREPRVWMVCEGVLRVRDQTAEIWGGGEEW